MATIGGFLHIPGSWAGRNSDREAGPIAARLPGARLLLFAVMMIGLNLLLTLVRHELMHILGGLVTGGTITRVALFPGLWRLGVVENSLPLVASAAAVYVPLSLPYMADLLLIVAAAWICSRWNLSPIATRWIVQQGIYFAALDILVNCAASIAWTNDWSMMLSGSGIWRYPALVVTIAGSLTAMVIGRRFSAFRAPSARPVRFVLLEANSPLEGSWK